MVNKKEFIWNMIASVFASALSAILLLVVTNINGLDDAGIFSIAFATATILNAISDYGMRVYQVTDGDRRYNFSTYLRARVYVDLAMMICAVGFVFIMGYDIKKALICILLAAFRFVDNLSETFQGEFQLDKRLDIAGKSVTFRMTAAVLMFCAIDYFTKNILIAFLMLFIMNALVFVIYDVRLIKNYVHEKHVCDNKAAFKIILDCFPVFASTFLNLYIINAPKYAIDKYMTNSDQTFFNIIYLPTFTINLLSIFILKPLLKSLGDMWAAHEYKKINGVVIKMVALIAGITVFVELICATIAIPILNILSGNDLAAYKGDLILLVVSGGLSAITVMLFYTLTTMRSQIIVLVAYIISAIIGFVASGPLVKAYGITGAAYSSIVIMTVLAIGLAIIYIFRICRVIKHTSDNNIKESR